jgi:tripartite-type tricarboxylate transporter receptor subunit TctC
MIFAGLAVLSLAASATATAQSSGGRPVRLVLQSAAGSAPDLIIRPLVSRLPEISGRQFIVDNRPGAAGILAAQVVAGAAPDGHTLLFGSSGTMSIAPFLMKKAPFDPVADFAPVTLVAVAPLVLSAHPSLPVKSMHDLIAVARAKPGESDMALQAWVRCSTSPWKC